ncbi:type II secretion system F family protein [Limisphaera sp. VF-2]|jgi:type IV pilus assembly protein PilC|uniref:type II secretion system F family protein n=1 Tax=Limisphaera sp. VF-2 TaxID=3400418 RepID=UPI00175F72FB|nr:type II secretion system F family protein [Limisphaera sp.]
MPKYSYVAMDAHGKEVKGVIEVASQNEAIGRIREMNLFPTKIVEVDGAKAAKKTGKAAPARPAAKGKKRGALDIQIKIPGLGGRVKPKVLMTFTRQLATLVDAGLPLLRGLRVLEKQERNPTLKNVIGELALAVEGGSTFSEALAQHPKIFNRLYVNMVKAGEMGGVLEVVLNRLAQFQEKAQKIKGKVVAAMFYPVAVLFVAATIITVLTVYVIPKFEEVFAGLLEGEALPAFTRLVLNISRVIRENILMTFGVIVGFFVLLKLATKTKLGRLIWDKIKLKLPAIGPLISKLAIARFTRTLGTLVSSGVPILQALTIVKETAGNVVIANAIAAVHDSVKEGETITAPLEASGVFPPMVISMVDVGEQTGALPEMLLKIADNYDDEVDNAVAAMTSLLEPIMIVCLAVIVGSIVIAMFLPLIKLMEGVGEAGGGRRGAED